MKIIKFLGSLYFALFLIFILTFILIVSTTMESVHGTPFAQKFFYQAGWFDALLGLVAVNLTASVICRRPLKLHHTGFIVTHVGIVLVLIGSFLSRVGGVDGQMVLEENQQKDKILLSGYELTVHGPDHTAQSFALRENPSSKSGYVLKGPSYRLNLHRAMDRASWKTQVDEGSPLDTPNHAVFFKLESSMLGLSQEQWLIEKNMFEPESARVSMGPAFFEIREKPMSSDQKAHEKPKVPTAIVTQKSSGKSVSIQLDPLPKEPVLLLDTGLVIQDIHYFPDARVNEVMKIVSVSDEPLNPAVEFTITDASGRTEVHTRFVHFPDFDSLHGKKKEHNFGVLLDLAGPWIDAHDQTVHGQEGPSLVFHPGENWEFTSRSKKGAITGKVEIGKPLETGWMDMHFTVLKTLDHAKVWREVVETSGNLMAAEISISVQGVESEKVWVTSDEPGLVETSKGKVLVSLGRKLQSVPFKLALKDFRKVDYPGTQNAQSYESDVVLEDTVERLKIEKTISMNKPLDYKGYRVFQSSFVQDAELGEASVFTVAKNPGVGLIYSGSIILFLGVMILFYIPRLSSFSGKNKGEVG